MATRTTEGPLLAGRYRVIERLGTGGMAVVYLAHDERLDRNVAVKRMHTSDRDDLDARRFKREAKLGASLSHPNLVSIFDTHEDDESVLLAMEYVDGETLADRLARGPIEASKAVEIVRAVAQALDHAHSAGIVHRDIKPANVLLGRDGSVKLADLGIAKAVERTDITGTGTVLGTPAYMAPEQLEGGTLGPTVDVYALAAMAFEMLTGHKARRGRTAVEIAHQVVNEPPPDAREVNPGIPAAAADALRRGMAKHADDRPASACEFADRLERGIGRATRRIERARPVAPVAAAPQTPSAGAPQYVAERTRHVRWLPIAGLLAAALAAGVVALNAGGEDDGGQERAARDREPAGENQREKDNALPTEANEAPAAEPVAEPPTLTDVPKPSGAGTSEQAEQLHLQGHAALEAGDYDTAIELNTRAIEALPEGTTWETDLNYAYALFSLGKALRLADRPDEAVRVLEVRRQIPNQPETVQAELDLARAAAAE